MNTKIKLRILYNEFMIELQFLYAMAESMYQLQNIEIQSYVTLTEL